MPKPPVAFSQNDPRWAGEVYAGGSTFATAGCLVCCVAMILSQYGRPPHLVGPGRPDPYTPPEVAEALRSAGAFSGNLLSSPARIPQAFPLVEWGGAVHWRTVPADLTLLARQIELYTAVIVELKWNPRGPLPQRGNQHFAVLTYVTGYDGDIIDPWDGQTKALRDTRYRLEYWSPARAIYGARLLHGVETK